MVLSLPRDSARPGFQPVRIVEVDLVDGFTALTEPGPTRLLVRLAGQVVGFIPITVPPRGLDPVTVSRLVAPEIRGVLPEGLLPPDAPLPVEGFPAAAMAIRPGPSVDAPAISVVVTACEASDGLRETLRCLLRQRYPAAEILLVDNRPGTSGLRPFLAASPDLAGVTLLEERRPGISSARNAGLARVRTELVAFTDDDGLIDEGWLGALVNGFTDEQVACVTGLVLPRELRTPAQCWFEEFGGYSKGFRARRFDLGAHRGDGRLYPFAPGVFGTGANVAFRTQVLRSIGGYDERLGTGTPTAGGEDLDMYLTIVQSGWSLVYEPAALIRHAHHATLRELRRQIHGYGIGLSAMVVKRWTTYREERRELNTRLLLGLRYLLSSRSGKNASKGTSYPRSLTLLELAGIARGPFAYWKSRRSYE